MKWRKNKFIEFSVCFNIIAWFFFQPLNTRKKYHANFFFLNLFSVALSVKRVTSDKASGPRALNEGILDTALPPRTFSSARNPRRNLYSIYVLRYYPAEWHLRCCGNGAVGRMMGRDLGVSKGSRPGKLFV